MFIFQTRYRDQHFEGANVRSKDFYIHTEDEKVAKSRRGRKDVWELTGVAEIIEAEGKPDVTGALPPRKPGRPKGIRGTRTVVETQGE